MKVDVLVEPENLSRSCWLKLTLYAKLMPQLRLGKILTPANPSIGLFWNAFGVWLPT